MRVGIICNSYPTTKNPHNQIFIKNLKEHLEKHGLNIEVCYNKTFDLWGDANTYKGIFANLIKYSIFLFNIISFIIHKGIKIDIIFSHAVVLPTTFAILLKRVLNIPVVCYVHGGDVNAYPTAGILYKKIMKFSLDNSDYIIVNSKDIYEKVKKITGNKLVQKISPGIDTDTMKSLQNVDELKNKLGVPSSKFIILAAGNAIKRKGFDVLLNAVNNLNKEVLANSLLIVLTEGPQREKLESFVREQELKDYISIRDKVSHRVLNQYYNIADVFIFPSRKEPLGLVGIEAMAAGTIVIGSRVGGIKEYISDGENGFLFEPENHIALSRLIEKVYINIDQFDDLNQEADKIVQEHSIDHSVQKIYDIFKSLNSS